MRVINVVLVAGGIIRGAGIGLLLMVVGLLVLAISGGKILIGGFGVGVIILGMWTLVRDEAELG